MPDRDAWRGFIGTAWRSSVDVADFIRRNYTPYLGDGRFLVGATARTVKLWEGLAEAFAQERERGISDVDPCRPAGITAHPPAYIDREHELIVGLQSDAPPRRDIMPAGDLRLIEQGLAVGCFRVITGLPEAYGRGRIVGDYRRVTLYGVDRLIEEKRAQRAGLDEQPSTVDVIRDREELTEQLRALEELKETAAGYGFDIGRPAADAHEAVQWLYFGYLAATEHNGAAMSLGRTSTFLDIYLERDLAAGQLCEERAQELIDDLIIKLRLVRFPRIPAPWVTEAIGGIDEDGRPLVTRTSFRYLQTLYNLGPAPEPNLTVLWSRRLPTGFKRFCTQVSLDTSAIQYQNDDLLRGYLGDDATACCLPGAGANLAKALLYAVNGGRDEVSGEQVTPAFPPVTDEFLDYHTVLASYGRVLDWLAAAYVDALNLVHAMHDRYAYERLETALHDYPLRRFLACGIAGLSVAVDSLSAIRYATVRAIRNADGLAVDYETDGDFPRYGNNDDRADRIAVWLVETFLAKLRRQPTYRDAEPTLSALTITSNVVHGKHTGNTPDGRRAGEPFAPGANPMNGRDRHGLVAANLSVAKLPYAAARGGISLTNTVVPDGLGDTRDDRIVNLAAVLDGYTDAGGYHMDVNVLDKATLEDAMAHPEHYPNLTIRVSGYAANFVSLTAERQRDVLSRTIHAGL